jgi:hypothetical protein
MKPLKVTIFFLFFSFGLYAQGSHHSDSGPVTENKLIAYAEKIGLTNLPESVTFKITTPSGAVVNGNGPELETYIFEIPGNYKVEIDEHLVHNPNTCNHTHYPQLTNVTVSPVKMFFHFDELNFTSDINSGVDTRGITMTVPVTVETVGEQNLEYKYRTAISAGIGTNIIATLKEGTVLKKGKQVLEYQLSGVATQKTYIMFDFTDINGLFQTAYLKKAIQ